MLNFCDFIQVYVFTTNHHLKLQKCWFLHSAHIHSELIYIHYTANVLYLLRPKFIFRINVFVSKFFM